MRKETPKSVYETENSVCEEKSVEGMEMGCGWCGGAGKKHSVLNSWVDGNAMY